MALDVSTQILNTKLQIPKLPSDLIPRKELIEYVNQNIERPLTLVSAGGGFGKSTFVSNWLKETPYKNAWFSIDENDNDLRIFLTYFIAAIRKIIPDFGQKVNSFILTSKLPPTKIIINSLINDLDRLSELFLLTLDDIHLINNKDIFEMLAHLLKYSPKYFHLILITRIDPPLPLVQLRSKNMMKDIRALHLKITNKEIELFVKHWIRKENVNTIVDLLEKRLDGWVTGLRLAMLHISFYQKNYTKLEKYLLEANFSEDYFLEEVFEHLEDNTKDFLLKTSILEKFSSSITNYILALNPDDKSGKNIINRLIKKNLFIINLDTENKWYRYHHLFQSLLRRELKKKFSKKEINALHKKAIEWYESNSMFEDGFYHVLQTGNNNTIASFIEKHMHQPLNVDKWYILNEWLKKLPDEIMLKSATLLIAQMWMLHHKNRIWVIPDFLQKIDKLKKTKNFDKEIEIQIQFFEAVLLFFSSQIEESYKIFNCIKDFLLDDKIGMKGITAMYYAVVAQMNGKGKEVVQEFEKKLSHDNISVTYRHLLLGGIVFAKLIEGNLFAAKDYVIRIKKSALISNDFFVLSWLDYFLGLINFRQNNLEEAENYFKKALDKIYLLTMQVPIEVFAGLLLILQALNKKEEFEEVYSQMIEFINERNNPLIEEISYSLRARLALLNNDLQSAEKYMAMTDMLFDSGNVLFDIEIQRQTYIKLLLAQNTPSKIDKAISKLDELFLLFSKTENISQLITTLVLQAVAYKKKGDNKKAIDALVSALAKGEHGRWISPFVEVGQDINELLIKIESINSKEYITQILNNLPTTKKLKLLSANIDKLTNREEDIIDLLAKRLSNKEIASTLFISPSTVKRHTITIYQKLGVNSRREAVIKAYELGFLQNSNNN